MLSKERFMNMSVSQIKALNLCPNDFDKIPIEKRIKMLDDYSKPVRFGPALWHILAIAKESALLMMCDPLENVSFDFMSRKLELFTSENFTTEEREAIIPVGYPPKHVLQHLEKSDIDRYLDNNQKRIGRHWWVKPKEIPSWIKKSKTEDSYNEPPVCINQAGQDDTNYTFAKLCIRPVANIKIPFDIHDTQWNRIWENPTFSEINFIGKWVAKLSNKPETETLHCSSSWPKAKSTTYEVDLVPIIDTTDM